VVGIESDRDLWVQALTAAGYQVYAVNPLAVPRRVTRDGLSKSHAMAAFVVDDALVRLGSSSCTIRVMLRRGTLPVPASSSRARPRGRRPNLPRYYTVTRSRLRTMPQSGLGS